MPHPPQLIIFGHVGYDVIYLDGVEKSRHVAGAAYYSAIGASRFTKNIGVVTRVNQDDKLLIEKMRDLDILVDGVKLDASPSPEFKLYYQSQSKINERDIFRKVKMSFGCGKDIKFSDMPISFFLPKYIYLSTAPPRQQLEWIREIRDKFGKTCQIAVDSVERFIEEDSLTLFEVIKLADIMFTNRREYHLLNAISQLKVLLVIKKGADGAEIRLGDEIKATCPAPNVDFVDSTGSGDVLAGALLALLSSGNNYSYSLQASVKLASMSVTQYGVEHLFCEKTVTL
jgi:sugar/nucleoside kinase (ribokinase family)